MRLTVLGGVWPPYPPAGGACSGYLLENDGDRILIDCGNGVLSRLQKYLAPWELDAIVISHLHNDHISDLFILRYAQLLAQKGEIPIRHLIFTSQKARRRRSLVFPAGMATG